jgi:hypothetical protein
MTGTLASGPRVSQSPNKGGRVLYKPEAFEPLTDEPWDEARVASAIRDIVADAHSAFAPDTLWPVVEGFDDARGKARMPLTALYSGASGVLWRSTCFAGADTPNPA